MITYLRKKFKCLFSDLHPPLYFSILNVIFKCDLLYICSIIRISLVVYELWYQEGEDSSFYYPKFHPGSLQKLHQIPCQTPNFCNSPKIQAWLRLTKKLKFSVERGYEQNNHMEIFWDKTPPVICLGTTLWLGESICFFQCSMNC